VNSLPF